VIITSKEYDRLNDLHSIAQDNSDSEEENQLLAKLEPKHAELEAKKAELNKNLNDYFDND